MTQKTQKKVAFRKNGSYREMYEKSLACKKIVNIENEELKEQNKDLVAFVSELQRILLESSFSLLLYILDS